MTSTPEAIDRKIRQLDNDVQSIYEMLARIEGTQRRHGNRLDEIDGGLAELKSDVTGLKADVGELKTDVGELKTDVGELKGGLAEIGGKVDRILAALER